MNGVARLFTEDFDAFPTVNGLEVWSTNANKATPRVIQSRNRQNLYLGARVMPAHDWSRVTHGDFHDFHSSWITHLKESLNNGLLPEGYYAQAEQHAGRTIADILTLSTRTPPPNVQAGVALAEAPPRVSFKMVADDATSYRVARRTVAIRHWSGRQVIAMIEVVSPGNKDGQQHLRQFTDNHLGHDPTGQQFYGITVGQDSQLAKSVIFFNRESADSERRRFDRFRSDCGHY